MRSAEKTRGFGAVSTLMLAGAAVLVFHSAALAQQAESGAKAGKAGAKEVQKAGPEPKAAPVTPADAPAKAAPADVEVTPAPDDAAKPVAPSDELPPEYGPPPGYRGQGPAQPPPPPPTYAPYGNESYYGPYGYPPPPQRYYRPRHYQGYQGYPAPVRYYPQPITYRPFFFGVGLGFGGVGVFPAEGESSSRVGMAYNLHFGFGVSSRWSIVLAGDGAYSYFTPYSVSQSVWSIGPQVFLNRQLYVRAGIGVATKSIDLNTSSYDYYSYDALSDSGMGWSAAIGWEFMQSYHVALGLELAATLGHYQSPDSVTQSKNDGTIGLNFMLNLF